MQVSGSRADIRDIPKSTPEERRADERIDQAVAYVMTIIARCMKAGDSVWRTPTKERLEKQNESDAQLEDGEPEDRELDCVLHPRRASVSPARLEDPRKVGELKLVTADAKEDVTYTIYREDDSMKAALIQDACARWVGGDRLTDDFREPLRPEIKARRVSAPAVDEVWAHLHLIIVSVGTLRVAEDSVQKWKEKKREADDGMYSDNKTREWDAQVATCRAKLGLCDEAVGGNRQRLVQIIDEAAAPGVDFCEALTKVESQWQLLRGEWNIEAALIRN